MKKLSFLIGIFILNWVLHESQEQFLADFRGFGTSFPNPSGFDNFLFGGDLSSGFGGPNFFGDVGGAFGGPGSVFGGTGGIFGRTGGLLGGTGGVLGVISPAIFVVGIGAIILLVTNNPSPAASPAVAPAPTPAPAPVCSSYPGYTFDSPTGVCYKVISTGYTQQQDGVAACNADSGGRLLRVDNVLIQNLAKTVMTAKGMPATWIDAVRQGPSSPVWKDTDNNDLTFFDFAPGQPGTNCCFLAMLPSGQMLAGGGGGSAIPVICEIVPRPLS